MPGILENAATLYLAGLWDDGTNAYGTLVSTNSVGIANPSSFDAFGNVGGHFGTTRDTFGITAVSGGVTLTGYVDPPEGGVVNMTSGTPKFSGVVTAPQTVTIWLMNGAAKVLQVDQVFSYPFPLNPNILQVAVTLTNLTAGVLSAVKARKITTYTQVDSTTGQPNTVATVPAAGFSIGGGIVCSDVCAFSFGPSPSIQPADPTVPFHSNGGGNYNIPGTYAAAWDLAVPNLAPGGTNSFSVYFSIYKTGQLLADTIADLVALGLVNYFTGTNASTSKNSALTSTVGVGGLTGAVAFPSGSGGQTPGATIISAGGGWLIPWTRVRDRDWIERKDIPW